MINPQSAIKGQGMLKRSISPSLEEILEYNCPAAIGVFRRKFLVQQSDAESLWKDLIRWLWLGRYHQLDADSTKPKALFISTPLIAIDEMWHSFLLCTKEYSEFCARYFGEFLHHVPDVENLEPATETSATANYKYVVKHLGATTAARWFVTLPLQFEGAGEKPTFPVFDREEEICE